MADILTDMVGIAGRKILIVTVSSLWQKIIQHKGRTILIYI